jgi:ectoine hydroxylase-related dioxygenase (phytanoyl-CoA dioxygenase family)
MTELTPEQLTLLPNEEDVAFYHDHGYYVSKKLFSDEEIDAAVQGSERFYARALDEPEVPFGDQWRPNGDYGSGLRKHDYASFFNRELAQVTRSPLIGAVAARLAATSAIRLWHDQLLYKPVDRPDTRSNVGWHTDRGYWKTCTSANMLTAWIPFHDCDADMGTIAMIDGSHRWPDNTTNLNFFQSDLEALEREFDTGGQPIVKVPINLKKGEVSFHHCLTIHGSGPNRGCAPRRSIAVHLQDADNRYQEYSFPDGRHATHGNDALARSVNGVPDYTDPRYFPTLWSQAE